MNNDETKNSYEIELEDNMGRYIYLKNVVSEYEKEMDDLKNKNLELLEFLKMDSFISNKLDSVIIKTSNKIKVGVDENALRSLIGDDKLNSMKRVDLKILQAEVKQKNISELALECILTIDGKTYTKISKKRKEKDSDKSNINITLSE